MSTIFYQFTSLIDEQFSLKESINPKLYNENKCINIYKGLDFTEIGITVH